MLRADGHKWRVSLKLPLLSSTLGAWSGLSPGAANSWSFRESVTGILLPVSSREGTPEKLMPFANRTQSLTIVF